MWRSTSPHQTSGNSTPTFPTASLDANPPSAQGEALGCPSVAFEGGVPQEIQSDIYARCEAMAKLVFGMMQSLDGYVDGVAGGLALPPPGVALSRHFNDHVRGLAGCLYGRRIYEIMRYWDEDRPEWGAGDREFAAALSA